MLVRRLDEAVEEEALSNAQCDHAHQAVQAYTATPSASTVRTMVCLPIGTSVLELGSTEVIFHFHIRQRCINGGPALELGGGRMMFLESWVIGFHRY